MKLEKILEISNQSGFFKNIASNGYRTLKKVASILVLSATSLMLLQAQEANDALETTPKIETISDENSDPKEVHRFMGSISAVGGYGRENFPIQYEGTPILAISSFGLNLLDRDRSEGTIIFPNIRGIVSFNRPEYEWGNQAEISIGAIAQMFPFQMGAEVGYRIPFGDNESEAFIRAWANYWGNWSGKSTSELKAFPLRLWGTQYVEFRYDSAMESAVMDARADINLDLLRIGSNKPREYTYPGLLKITGVTVTPFIAATMNLDVKNDPWNRWIQGSGGIKLVEGGYQLVSEMGYRKSFNSPDYEGLYGIVELQAWLPLDLGKHESRRSKK